MLKTPEIFLPKMNSPFHASWEIALPSFCPKPQHSAEELWHSSDVRRAQKIYIKHTEFIRSSGTLFVSFWPNCLGLRVIKLSLARWIRLCVEACKAADVPVPEGIKEFSTIFMVTLWVKRACDSTTEICKAAIWSLTNVFIRHYRVDFLSSAEGFFGKKVIKVVVQ